jgi:hypothetical protein
MIEIPLTGRYSDRVALIDDEDARLVVGRSWYGHTRGGDETVYARSGYTFLHHLVLKVEPNFRRPIEHLDQNGLNCQKANLMISTQSRNGLNRLGRAQANNLYGKHAGVSFDKSAGKWTARIGACNYWYGLGYYTTEEDALAMVTKIREQLLAIPEDQWKSFMSQFKRPEQLSMEVLHQKYIVEGMSTGQIAKEIGSTKTAICRWLREYGIPARPVGYPAKPTREFLEQKYTVEGLQINRLADELETSRNTIRAWLREYGIPSRPPGRRTYQTTY